MKTNIINHDTRRPARCGVPEVVYGAGKSAEDLSEIMRVLMKDCGRFIATKTDEEKAERITREAKKQGYLVRYNKKAGVLVVKKKGCKTAKIGTLAVITAGTSDIPVAEEAREIAEELGCKTLAAYDVGVAGIHRIFTALEKLRDADTYIVVAGMEGALPTIVSGLVAEPVIGVPTSVGYGTAEKGKTALYTMLNSCSPLAVVNIDNGYGAAVMAYKILRAKNKKKK